MYGGRELAHTFGLFSVLFGVWLILSGFFAPFFLIIGAVCSLLAVVIAMRMEVVDHEAYPFHLTGSLLTYLPWLAWQVVLSNIDVSRKILSPRLPIDPVLAWVPAGQKSDLVTVIHANSITLTPGTVCTAVEHGRIQVHCLTPENLAELEAGGLDRRATALEGDYQ